MLKGLDMLEKKAIACQSHAPKRPDHAQSTPAGAIMLLT